MVIVSTVVSDAHRALIHDSGLVVIEEQASETEWTFYNRKQCATLAEAKAWVNGYFGLIDSDMPGEGMDAYMAGARDYFAPGVFSREQQARNAADNARAIMCAMNRSRAESIRARAWSENARDYLAFHAFALAGDKDGITSKVDAALRMVPRFVRQYETARAINRHCVAGIREAWRGAWSDARRMVQRRGA